MNDRALDAPDLAAQDRADVRERAAEAAERTLRNAMGDVEDAAKQYDALDWPKSKTRWLRETVGEICGEFGI
jgi:hypothetical protein